MNVLIVEDNKELAVEVYDFLCNSGYICKIANNCAEALEEFGSNDYDVMLLDLGLPDGDGFEVLQAIRKTKSKIAVIVLTARGELDDRINGLHLGADDYLTKPFALTELASKNICSSSQNSWIYS
ncbi:response regulator [Flavobacterium ginsengisoli]|uniref:response regulator n=1 Tax=Flavobacterium ginsengisoli TaxID=871694 RepID=UPI0024158478|nr:response regulator [Flavobacterium ginsengisoli]